MRKAYAGPPVALLREKEPTRSHGSQIDWIEAQEVLENKTYQYGVNVKLLGAERGPMVTTYRVDIGAQKTAATKFTALRTDLQRWFRSNKPVRIVPPRGAREHWKVQVANKQKDVVCLREVLESEEYRSATGDLVIPIGKTDRGKILTADVAAFPNAIIAGETGSGKSVFLSVVLTGLIFRYSPEEVKFLLIDLKEVELSQYADLPHLLCDIVTDRDGVAGAMRWIREEVIRRFTTFKSAHVRNLNEYNAQEGVEKLPRIVVAIDEASEIMTNPRGRREVEQTSIAIARLGRSAGIHMLLATQNPTRTVVTNELQINFNTRIAFAVGDASYSTVILREKGAECLVGRGDMLLKQGQTVTRAHVAYVGSDEADAMARFVVEHNERVGERLRFDEEVKKEPPQAAQKAGTKPKQAKKAQETSKTGEACEVDAKWRALRYMVEAGNASASLLQRKMRIGFVGATAILTELEKDGYVSAPKGVKRTLLIDKDAFVAEWEKRYGTYDDDKDEE